MTYEEVRRDPAVKIYIAQADASMQALGFTEHSFAHVTRVAKTAGDILEILGYPARTVELARIAGYLHDIGNVVNRVDHSQSGAVMAFRILDRMNFPPEEIASIVTAIGNHDEGTGVPVNAVSAAPFPGAQNRGYRPGYSRPGELLRDPFGIEDRFGAENRDP